MNMTKYICMNILSILGNVGFSILLCMLFITLFMYTSDYNYLMGLIAFLGDICFRYYIVIIPLIILILPIEMFIHKIAHNKFIIDIAFKNEKIRYTYNILFWLGIISSVLYLLFYLWFVTR